MSVFKEYDIRGIYPAEIDEKFAYDFGKALALYFKSEIAVGRDVRLSSNSLAENLIKGITDAGQDVIDVGIVSAPMMAFISKNYNSVVVTASHNPKEYNGFKTLRKGVIDVGLPNGLLDVKDLMDRETPLTEKGNITRKDFTEEYLKHVLKFADIKKRLKVVVDAGNGTQGPVDKLIFEKINCELVPLFFEPDGNFPGRGPDPSKPESLVQLKELVVKEKADLGVAFDCDGDRIIFVDEKGSIVPSEAVLLFLAKKLIKPKDIVVATVNCSRSIEEFVDKFKGKLIRCPVGRTNVAAVMRDKKGIVGGEVSGHFFFKDNFFKDAGDITMLTLISQLSQEERPFSEMVHEYIRYPGKRFNIRIKSMDDIDNALSALEKEFSDGKLDKMDGIKIIYDNWWFNARASKTEPVLRITIEADDEKILDEKEGQIKKILESV